MTETKCCKKPHSFRNKFFWELQKNQSILVCVLCIPQAANDTKIIKPMFLDKILETLNKIKVLAKHEVFLCNLLNVFWMKNMREAC